MCIQSAPQGATDFLKCQSVLMYGLFQGPCSDDPLPLTFWDFSEESRKYLQGACKEQMTITSLLKGLAFFWKWYTSYFTCLQESDHLKILSNTALTGWSPVTARTEMSESSSASKTKNRRRGPKSFHCGHLQNCKTFSTGHLCVSSPSGRSPVTAVEQERKKRHSPTKTTGKVLHNDMDSSKNRQTYFV